jgi:predicted HD phosphohydrolase
MGPAQVFTDADALLSHLEILATLSSADHPALTELDHALQCADRLRRDWPDDVELQVAGLLHDLAHPWDGAGQTDHASIGAASVGPMLGPRVAGLVAGHVEAKRYLVAVAPDYLARLSADSVATLEAQGGPLSPDAATLFASRPDRGALVGLRLADDAAKVPGAVVPGLASWAATVKGLCRAGVRTPTGAGVDSGEVGRRESAL